MILIDSLVTVVSGTEAVFDVNFLYLLIFLRHLSFVCVLFVDFSRTNTSLGKVGR